MKFCLRNHCFDDVPQNLGWIIVTVLMSYVIVSSVLYSSPSYAQRYQAEYAKLLDSCGLAINDSGYEEARKVLTRKVYSGRRYKLWIDVTSDEDSSTVESHRVYCEGITHSGEIEVFALAEGAWRNKHWTADTTLVMEESLVQPVVAKK